MGILDNFANTALNAAKAGLGVGGSTDFGSGSTDPALRNRDYAVIITQEQNSEPGKSSRVVVGSVPQSIQINQNVDWKAPFGAGLAGSSTVADILAMTGNRLVGQVMTMQVWQGSGNEFDFNIQFELRAWSDPYKDVILPLQTLLMMSAPSLDSTGFLLSPGPILTEEGIKALGGQLTKVTSTAVNAGIDAYKAKPDKSLFSGDSSEFIGKTMNGASAVASSLKTSGIMRKQTIEQYLKNKISIRIGRWFNMENVLILGVQHDLKGQTPDARTGQIQAASVTVSFKPMFAITAEDVMTMFQGGMSQGAASGAAAPPSATSFPVGQ